VRYNLTGKIRRLLTLYTVEEAVNIDDQVEFSCRETEYGDDALKNAMKMS
jgi:hypothetical protein